MASETSKRARRGAEFPQPVKAQLAAEAGYRCANPACRAPTHAAGSTVYSVGHVGEAAHISGATEHSARWQQGMDPDVRKSAANGIWLCKVDAREIDVDSHRYPIALLHRWKRRAKQRALLERGKPEGWRAKRRDELLRTSRVLENVSERDDVHVFVSMFLADVDAPSFWNLEELDSIQFALYELILNALDHGRATWVNLRSRGVRVDLVHDGSDFNPSDLLNVPGRGGAEALRGLVAVFGNNLSMNYRHNGSLATTQLIDAGAAGPGSPCAVEIQRRGVTNFQSLRGCSTVHVFPPRALSYSDGEVVEPAIVNAPADAIIVIHGTSPKVVEYFRRTYPRVDAPGHAIRRSGATADI